MLDENVGQIVVVGFIIAAVGIFVGSRLFLLFRK